MDQAARELQSNISDFNAKLSLYNELYLRYMTYIQRSPPTRTLNDDFDISSTIMFQTIGTQQTPVPYTSGQTGCFNACIGNTGCYGASYDTTTTTTNQKCNFQLDDKSLLGINPANSTIKYMIPKKKSLLYQLKQKNDELLAAYTIINNKISTSVTSSLPGFNTEIANKVTTMDTNYKILLNKRKEIEKTLIEIDSFSDANLDLVNKNIYFEMILIIFYAIVFIMFRMMGVSSSISYVIIVGFAIVTGMIIINKLVV